MNLNKVIVKINKILLVVCLFTLIINVLNDIFIGSTVFADDDLTSKFSGTDLSSDTEAGVIKKIIAAVLRIVRDVGVAVALAMIVIVATKYIMASAGERADIKKSAINYVIGALVLFGAAGIAGIMKNFITGVFTTTP